MNQPPRTPPVSKRTIQGLPVASGTGSGPVAAPAIPRAPSLPSVSRDSSPERSASGIAAIDAPSSLPGGVVSTTAGFDAPPSSAPKSDVPSIAPPPPNKKSDPYIGVTIDGRYKVESVLGEGGMGVVYAARHKVIDKRVAIKILRQDLSTDRDMTDRFLQEARAASSIGHPHIVDVSDFGELPDGSAYFVMEFLEGRNLGSVLNDTKPLPLKRLTNIGKQIADALFGAHEKGIVHRDLKPDNVFLISRGHEKDFVKILDFGIAKVASAAGTQKLTRAGTVFGTPHYMSPEQAAGAPVDHRTDIYALGVILYEMASGKVPFDADNYMGILTQHMYKAPVPIRALMPPVPENVPPGLEAIILKTLSKKPEQRYQTMHEVLEDFERLENGQMPTAVSEMIARSGSFNVPADYFSNPARNDAVVPGTPSAGRPRWPLYAGIAGVALAIGLVAAIFSTGSTSKAQTPATAASSATTPTADTAAPPPATSIAPVVSAPKGKPVVIIAQPMDAEVVKSNGESLGKVPVTVDVPDGAQIDVELRREGFTTQKVTLDGSTPRYQVSMVAVPKGGPMPGGGKAPPPPPPTVKPPPGKKGGGGDVVDPWAK